MSANIHDFLANFKGGGLRPNRYRVILTFPLEVAAMFGSASEKIAFTCKATSIPESTIGEVPVPFMGREVKVAGDRTFENWGVTVMLDNDMMGRNVFETWHDLINGLRTNTSIDNYVNPSNYMGNAEVRLLDRGDAILSIYRVEYMFPTTVGSVSLGYDTNNSIAEQEVTFAINEWYVA